MASECGELARIRVVEGIGAVSWVREHPTRFALAARKGESAK